MLSAVFLRKLRGGFGIPIALTPVQMEGVMGRTILRIAGLAVLVAVFHVPAAHADTRFSFGVGVGTPYPPIAVAPGPYVAAPYGDDYYWEPAYRAWTGYGYRWVPGRWVHRGYGSSRWENERWRRERDRDRYQRDYRDDRNYRDDREYRGR